MLINFLDKLNGKQILLNFYLLIKLTKVSNSQQKQDQELTVAQIMNSLLPNSDSN